MPVASAARTLNGLLMLCFLRQAQWCGSANRKLFRARRLPLKAYEGQAVNYQVLEEWARVGVGSAILPRSKLSSADIGHPLVLGNGHPALIRFEAVWSPVTTLVPHLQALVQHFKHAGQALARPVLTPG